MVAIHGSIDKQSINRPKLGRSFLCLICHPAVIEALFGKENTSSQGENPPSNYTTRLFFIGIAPNATSRALKRKDLDECTMVAITLWSIFQVNFDLTEVEVNS